jgi:asparagine N-glycosylation enzyme membrane subunit Stt3
MKKNKAIKIINHGALTAFISGLITFFLVLAPHIIGLNKSLLAWNSKIIFFDVIFVFSCAYFIFKRSRVATVLMLIYFMLSKMILFLQNNNLYMLLASAVFTYFFIRAVYGAFIYHKIENTDKDKPKWIMILFIILSTGAFFGMASYIVYKDITAPPKDMLLGENIKKYHKDILVENDIVKEDEKINYFYSTGNKSILEGGSILTDNRVLSYKKIKDTLNIKQLYFNQISTIEQIYVGNSIISSKYRIKSKNKEDFLEIDLTSKNRADILFIGLLKAKIAYEEFKSF